MTSVVILIPLVFSLFETNEIDEAIFLKTAAICFILGIVGVKTTQGAMERISTSQLYMITTFCWLLFGFLGTLPLMYGLPHLSFTDATFESFSGITTTGSTVMTGLDNLPRSILIWRGLLQWIGGIGIIVLSIAVLPFLRVGGMKLFATESSDWSGKSHPRMQSMVVSILFVYVLLSVICVLLYMLFGMSAFDAVVHSMSTLSTGGFSNYDASFGAFKDHPALLWVSSLFMVLGALPFVFYVNAFRERKTQWVLDYQIKGFILFLAAVIVILSVERSLHSDQSLITIVGQVMFNVISITTTTGYASTNYITWGSFAIMIFFYLTFVGGCSGSTAGAMKFFRLQLAYMMLKNQLKYMAHPNGVFSLKYGGKIVSEDIIRSVVAFSMFYAVIIAVLAALLAMTGLDFVTSLTASATCVSNVGPGLGNIIGPSGNFATLSDSAKLLLSAGMLFGRLEIMTILVLFTPAIWK
jgi:trk system potassium uptake protein TrkH